MRCVNVDWLEVYCLEDNSKYPCNANYFRSQGYFVKERDYGTRTYREMFTIVDQDDNPLIEIRRNPQSGQAAFTGLLEQSTHIRLSNWMCYQNNPIGYLRNFLARHDYIFKRIYRIDVCYDFEQFDTGDKPAKFCRRYIEHVYAKLNQTHLATHGKDNWTDFEWEWLSWGNPKSMVTTKIYNKSKELAQQGKDKPYIKTVWFMCGLVDSPVTGAKYINTPKEYQPEIWRIEFSLHSKADNWLLIEDNSGKRVRKKAIRHSLSLFDSKEKLWERFQDMAYHYFRFKIVEQGKRKDRMKDKILFYWDRDRKFLQVKDLPKPSKPNHDDAILRRRLQTYKLMHTDPKIREACNVILQEIERMETRRFTPHQLMIETKALQAALALRAGGDERSTLELLAEVQQLLLKDEIW